MRSSSFLLGCGALLVALASPSACTRSTATGSACTPDDPSAGLVAHASKALTCTTCGTDLWQGAHLGPVAIASDGNVLVAGAYSGNASLGDDRHLTSSLPNPYGTVAFVTKLDREGKILWLTSYPTDQNSWIRGLVPLADGGAIAIGSSAGGVEAVLQRYSATGDVTATMPVGEDDRPTALAVAPDGDLVVTGNWVTSSGGLAQAWGPYVQKVGPDGTVRFRKQFTSTGIGSNDFGSVAVDSQSRIFVAGSVGGSSTDGLDITAPDNAATAIVAGFDANGSTSFVRSWRADNVFPLTVVLTAKGHPLVGGTLTQPASLGGEVLVPAPHGGSSSASGGTGGCDGCPPALHDASPFLLELGTDGTHVRSRLLEAQGAAGITSMAVSKCSILAVGDAEQGQYLAVLAPDTTFLRALPFRAFAPPNVGAVNVANPLFLGARDDGSYVLAGTFKTSSGPFTFGSLSINGEPYVPNGFVVDASKLMH